MVRFGGPEKGREDLAPLHLSSSDIRRSPPLLFSDSCVVEFEKVTLTDGSMAGTVVVVALEVSARIDAASNVMVAIGIKLSSEFSDLRLYASNLGDVSLIRSASVVVESRFSIVLVVWVSFAGPKAAGFSSVRVGTKIRTRTRFNAMAMARICL